MTRERYVMLALGFVMCVGFMWIMKENGAPDWAFSAITSMIGYSMVHGALWGRG